MSFSSCRESLHSDYTSQGLSCREASPNGIFILCLEIYVSNPEVNLKTNKYFGLTCLLQLFKHMPKRRSGRVQSSRGLGH